MPNVEIVDTTSYSSNFPIKSPHEIGRENILHTISLMLESETRVLLVHGRDGIGKTTVLSQFCKTHADRTVSVFLNASSRFGYDPNLVQRDISNQIWWLLYKGDAPVESQELDLPSLVYELQRASTKTKNHLQLCR
jgi:ATPase subunit of ABC transporter with duplicated ATPase domains